MTKPASPLEQRQIIQTLYDQHIERYDKRRQIEWRVTAGLWTAIVLMTGTAAGKVETSWYLIAACYGFIYAAFVIWTAGSFRANWNDHKAARDYQKELERQVTQRVQRNPRGWWVRQARKHGTNWCGFLWDWSRLSQLIGTLALLALSVCILSSDGKATTAQNPPSSSVEQRKGEPLSSERKQPAGLSADMGGGTLARIRLVPWPAVTRSVAMCAGCPTRPPFGLPCHPTR